MDKNIETIKRYFQLSDSASIDRRSLNEIIEMFSTNAEIISADGQIFPNDEISIESFFTDFFTRNRQLKHISIAKKTDNGYQASWVVCGRKFDDSLFCLKGIDYYQFSPYGLIKKLEVKVVSV